VNYVCIVSVQIDSPAASADSLQFLERLNVIATRILTELRQHK